MHLKHTRSTFKHTHTRTHGIEKSNRPVARQKVDAVLLFYKKGTRGREQRGETRESRASNNASASVSLPYVVRGNTKLTLRHFHAFGECSLKHRRFYSVLLDWGIMLPSLEVLKLSSESLWLTEYRMQSCPYFEHYWVRCGFAPCLFPYFLDIFSSFRSSQDVLRVLNRVRELLGIREGWG